MSLSHSLATARGLFRGTVDLTPSAGWAGDGLAGARVGDAQGRRTLSAPGIALDWDERRTMHALTRDALCITWGTPRLGASGDRIAARATATELLDHLARSGTDGIAEVRGAFGLLFVDARHARVLLAVDRFSRETACHALEHGVLACSDRADEVPVAARTLSSQALYDYLYFHCIPSPATIHAGITRLEPGTTLVVQEGRVGVESHWRPRFDASAAPGLPALADEFRALVRGAVAMEAGGDETLGCFLSGGTDSSTVAGMLREVTGRRVGTYSIGFDATGYDEMAYARIAARHFDTDHHEYYVTSDDVAAHMAAVARSFDQPFGNSSALPAYLCARMAAGDGVTRMLAGDGGDELFGGNSRYRLQLALGLYDRLPALARTGAIEPLLRGPLGRARVPGLRHLAAYVRHARTPMPDRLDTFNLLARIGAAQVIAPDVLAAADEASPRTLQRAVYARSTAAHLIDRILQYEWKYILADSDLPKVRGATELAGLSVGYPLLYDELVDFSLRLPARYKVRRFALRWFFKQALRDFLPAAIITKKKHGFGMPFGLWALQNPRLRELAADSLVDLESRGILRKGFRDPLLRDLLPAHPGYYGELLWILVMLELWLAGQPPAATRGALSGAAATAPT